MPSCLYWYALQWYYTSVLLIIDLCAYIYSTYYVLVCTSMYWYVLVCTRMEYGILPGRLTVLYTRLWGNTVKPQRYVLVYWHIMVCTSMYWYILVQTCMYW